MGVFANRPTLGGPCVGVYKRTSFWNLILFPSCVQYISFDLLGRVVRWIKCSYSRGFWIQNLLASSIFMHFKSTFFSKRFIRVQMVEPCSCPVTATACEKSRFILTDILDFYFAVVLNCSLCLSFTYNDITFCRWDIATKIWEEVYQCQKLDISCKDGSVLFKTQEFCFICVKGEANVS